jgi:hypothetical protein
LELPSEVDVDESSFADVIPLLPSLFADWRSDTEKRMLKEFGRMLNKPHRPRNQWSKILDDALKSCSPVETESTDEESSDTAAQLAEKIVLATTVFKCNDCSSPYWALNHWNDSDEEVDDECFDDDDFNESDSLWFRPNQRSSDATVPLFYPEVMRHRCLTRKVDFTYDNSDPSVKLDQLHRTRMRWSCKRLKVDKKAKTMMEAIVKHCGLDPAFATPKHMDDHNVLLGCPLCAEWLADDALVPVFGWRAAVRI